MKKTKYLLAKYVADLHRFEPRNIGVIVWSELGVEARFTGEYAQRPGLVDGRSIPNFVTSANAYKQWIRYWRDAISAEAVQPPGCESVSASSPDFPEALQRTSRGNFIVVDAGSVLEVVDESDLPAIADQLYEQLVYAKLPDEPRDLDLDEVADNLLDKLHLRAHRNFRSNYPVPCSVNGIEEEYTFSDAFANGTPLRLYQRLAIPKSRIRLRKNVHDTAWSFEQVIKQHIVERAATGVLVYVSEEQGTQPDVEKSLRLLGTLTRVINLRDERKGLEEFEPLVSLSAGDPP